MSSLADQLQRVIYRLKTEGAKDVQKDFEKIEDAAEGVAREAINVEKAVATIGIQAEETRGRLQRMVDAGGAGFNSIKGTLGQIGGGFQSAIKGVNDLTSKLGPWNQALELGGKAVKFVDESFDLLAKKEPGRRAEIEATRKSMQGLGDGVKQATAEFALFIAQQAEFSKGPIEEARKKYERLNKEIREFYKLDRGGAAAQGLGYLLNGGAADAVRETLASQWGGGLDETVGAGLDRLGEAGKKLAEENKKQAAENDRRHKSMLAEWARRERDVSEFIGKRGMDDVVGKPIGWDMGSSAGSIRDSFGADAFGNNAAENSMSAIRARTDEWTADLKNAGSRYQDYLGEQSESKLEKIFGPIEDFDAYQQSVAALGQTFDVFSQAVASGYAALVTGQGSVITALRATAAAGIMAQGQQSVIAGLRETALGFGAMALGSPTSAAHFKSAALHGAVAVAAGLAARALAPSASAPAAGGGGGATATGGTGRNAANDLVERRGEKDSRPITVIIGDPYTDMSVRMRSIKANEAVEKALRERDE